MIFVSVSNKLNNRHRQSLASSQMTKMLSVSHKTFADTLHINNLEFIKHFTGAANYSYKYMTDSNRIQKQ